MNEEEYFRTYMRPKTGMHGVMAGMGVRAGERDIVGRHLNRLHNAKNTGMDFFLPDHPSEYPQLRDKALTDIYGKGFLDMYKRYKPIGHGAFGAVFEKPGDPTRVLKVTREDTLRRMKMGDREVNRQMQAASIRRAPMIHSVTNYPYQHETPEAILGSLDTRYGTDNPRHKVIEMDKVKTINDQGGKIQMLQDYVLKMQGLKPEDRKYGTYDKFEKPYRLENAKYNLAVAKAQLHLADAKGIVHTDLGADNSRTDHIAYNPRRPFRTKFIDYGFTRKFNHAENLHKHTQNLNLRNQELKSHDLAGIDGQVGLDVEHFLDHKVANISQGLKALGRSDEANAFRNEYQSYVDRPGFEEDYESADNLVRRGTKEVRLARYKNVQPMLNKEELDLM